jgi:hypothetical protein
MYAHPSFVRDQHDSLSELRKLTSTSSRRRAREVPAVPKENKTYARRSVSPSPTLMLATAQVHFPMASRMHPNTMIIRKPLTSYSSPQHTSVWAPIHKVPLSPDMSTGASSEPASPPPKKEVGRGRLDLLALAMEQATAMQQ